MRFFILSGVGVSLLAVCLAMTTYSAEVTPQELTPTESPSVVVGNPPLNSFDFWYGYFLGWKQGLADVQSNAPRPKPVKPNCKPVGAYCTYHEDCCSFACLSYLGKCVSH